MKERPILFCGPMVRAIQDGRKTQTRRIVKHPEYMACLTGDCGHTKQIECTKAITVFGATECPYGHEGDRLWVRETFQFVHANSDGQRNIFDSHAPFTQHDYRWIEYAATPKDNEPPPKWKPSIFMPRWASRITLEITSTRVERLNDISEEDAKVEGVTIKTSAHVASGVCGGTPGPAQFEYFVLWESINRKGSWAKNPLVWVIDFRRIKP